jgi:hypothetical protein
MNVKRLMELAGVSEQTIGKHLPAWMKEREEILANSNPASLALSLSAKELSRHKQDMVHLRNLVEAKKWEMNRVDEILAKLEGWMDKFDSENQEHALRILEAWQRSCAQRGALENQFLALQRQWTKLVGIEGLLDVALTREKELTKGRVKMDLKKENPNSNPLENRSPGHAGVFARRQEVITVERPESEEDDD